LTTYEWAYVTLAIPEEIMLYTRVITALERLFM